ncbi:MAG: carboxymuconolactone decarboxylase family protein [Burkholderiaceae bacterium]
MPRIPYHDLRGLPESLLETIRSRPPLNLYRMLPHAVGLMPGFMQMGKAIRTDTELDPKLRELVILRTGALLQASYEVHQHRRVAAQAGVAPDWIEAALRPGAESALPATEALLLRLTDAIVQKPRVPDELFESALKQFGPRQTSEILLIAGFYMMVSRFLENTGVEIEATPAF